jgi:hypothetical protein
MHLFMPSEIKDGHLRGRVCTVGMPDIEARMREEEASEALEDVRGGLRTRTMANRYKLQNYTGQGLLTRNSQRQDSVLVCSRGAVGTWPVGGMPACPRQR